MSKYTPKMEAELQAKPEWTYTDCEAFADCYPEVSTRSVISKIKNLGLIYIPKEKPAPTERAEQPERKSEIVESIATIIDGNVDKLYGLAKADKRALNLLRDILKDRLPVADSNEVAFNEVDDPVEAD